MSNKNANFSSVKFKSKNIFESKLILFFVFKIVKLQKIRLQ